MTRTAATCLAAAAAFLLASCQTPVVQYNGEQHRPSEQVDVFRNQTEIRNLHRVVGEGSLSVWDGMSRQEIRDAFVDEARRRGAHAVIIQDPADRPYSTYGYGADTEPARVVTAIFLRYDDNRRATPVTPPGNAIPPPSQPGFSAPWSPAPPPAGNPAEPYRDPYALPDEASR